jgi:hypothetical protein
MTRTTRASAAALTLGLALALTACGGGETSPTKAEASPATTSAEAVAKTPEVAEPTVAPTPTDGQAVAVFGEQGIESAYREMVDLATREAINPDFFLRDGNNSSANLTEIAKRLSPEVVDALYRAADGCVAGDSAECGNVHGIVFWDNGSDERPYTYRPDGQFVTEQSVVNPRVTAVSLDGREGVQVKFDHAVRWRMLIDGTPSVVEYTRPLTFGLVPAPPGSATRWLITGWHLDAFQPTLTDETTGQSIEP